MASFRWTCACCYQEFDTLPTCWRVGPPAPYQVLSEDERTSRAVINDDCCFVDGQFYIRGEIKIPIIDTGESFIWNVWASLAEDSADEMMRTWDNQDRDQVGPFIGWLSSNLPYDDPTIGLKTVVRNRPRGTAPFIELEPTDHPLAVEQREGVTPAWVAEIAGRLGYHARANG